ncbi:MAG: hypothetical protein QNK03_11135 [Myxococcota bacterium]|nr:hypothetical protein [Myxococcota bacterium]
MAGAGFDRRSLARRGMRVGAASALTLLALVAGAEVATAAPPPDLGYQGRLFDVDGAPLAGPVDLTIGIWDAPSEGTRLYAEDHAEVPLRNGVFGLLLGTGTPIHGSFDADLFGDANRWLEVAVDGEPLAPRQPFSSVAYALQSTDSERVGGIQSVDLVTLQNLEASFSAEVTEVHESQLPPVVTRDSEVLPIVLGSDGPGSNLDADRVDGLEAADLQRRYANVVVVDAGGRGDFLEPQDALDAITTAGSGNRFLVRILPGSYGSVVTKPYVDLEGAGPGLTELSGLIVEASGFTEIRSLAVRATGSTPFAVLPWTQQVTVSDVEVFASRSDAAANGIAFLGRRAVFRDVSVNASGIGEDIAFRVVSAASQTTMDLELQNVSLVADNALFFDPAFAAGNEPALRLRSSRLDGDLVLAPPIPGAGSSGWEVRISGTQVTGDVVNQSGFDPARQIPLFNELRCVGASDAAGVGLTSACGPGPPVATADLRDGAVDTEKLGAGAVTSEEVEDGSLTLADLDLIALAANFVLVPNTTGSRTLTCPVDYIALSGGWGHYRQLIGGQSRDVSAYVNGNPVDDTGADARRWTVGIFNDDNGHDIQVSVRVYCARAQ